MASNSIRKRTQFSSCDFCRRSRVACDASKRGHRLGQVRWNGSCSRCSRRNQSCTFEWISNVKNKHPKPCQEPVSILPTTEPDSNGSCESSSSTGPGDMLLTKESHQLFDLVFETIFGYAVGRHGCPLVYVDDPNSDICIPAMKLFVKLDAYLDEEQAHLESTQDDAAMQQQVKDLEITQSLECAIKAFVSRWLPLVPKTHHATPDKYEENARESWRVARKDMLRVINRTSYRSVLTLYLFSQTPVPIGISKGEELDGINPSLCLQTALLQVQRLRERRKGCPSHGFELGAQTGPPLNSTSNQVLTNAYLDLETRAYWAAVMWDTTNSLTSSFRPSLTSGLKGACSEPAWRLARSFLVGSFHTQSAPWRTQGFDVTDDTAPQILSATNISTLYVWKNLASLREALREGVDEDGILFAWRALLDAIGIHKTSVRPLVNKCERQLHFLDQVSRRRWFETSLRYYLGILVLVDTLEAAGRWDLLAQVAEARAEAEHESFNVLKFGIDSTYTILGPEDVENTNSIPGSGGDAQHCEQTITVSFIAIGPCRRHVMGAVELLKKAIDRKFRQGEMKREVYRYIWQNLESCAAATPAGHFISP